MSMPQVDNIGRNSYRLPAVMSGHRLAMTNIVHSIAGRGEPGSLRQLTMMPK